MSIVSKTISYTSATSPYSITEKEIELPLKPDFIVVKVSHIALNPIDIKIRNAKRWGGIVGKDFSGTVYEVASNLEGKFSKGERVCGHLAGLARNQYLGTYAVVNVATSLVIKQPSQYSDAEAAGLPLTFGTALALLNASHVNSSSRVLVLGAGSTVGQFLIQLLNKHVKVKEIVVTCSPRSSEQAHKLGAHTTIDYSDPNFVQNLVQSASEEKYQAIYDTVGGPEALYVYDKILKSPKENGTFRTVSGEFKLDKAKYSEFSLLTPANLFAISKMGFRMIAGKYLLGIDYGLCAVKGDWGPSGSEILAKDKYQIPIDTVYEFADYNAAIDKLDTMKAKGKVIIHLQ